MSSYMKTRLTDAISDTFIYSPYDQYSWVQHYLVVEDLNLRKRPLCMWYRANISLRFINNLNYNNMLIFQYPKQFSCPL